MTALEPVLLLIAIAYTGILGVLCAALLRHSRASASTPTIATPPVSIVIPFRNEALHLPALLSSLETQDHEGEIEIILVNDGSTDDSEAVIRSHETRHNITLIDSPFSAAIRLTGKQQALHHGIETASHELIALTDADMILDKSWLRSLVIPATRGAMLVFGHSVISRTPRPSLFAWFQRFQLETLFAVAYAFHRAGITGSCMGNNMLVTRDAYVKIGGMNAIGYCLVEDCALLTAARRRRLPTAVTEPFPPTAVTFPCATSAQFLQQFLRWARGGFTANRALACIGVLTGLLLALVIPAAGGMLPPSVTLLVWANLLFTWLFLATAFTRIRSRENAFLFPLFLLLFMAESVVVIASMFFPGQLSWKGKRI